MSNFEALYRSMDRLNAAIKKAEAYLSKHPAGEVSLVLPIEVCRKYNPTDAEEGQIAMRLTCFTTPELDKGEFWVEFLENGEWGPGFQLSDASLESRIMFSPFIPKLIELADASLVHKAEHVDSTAYDIEHAIAASEAARNVKPKAAKNLKR